MKNNQLKYIIFAGLFFIPFVPLIVAKSLFFPFITGKAFIFRLIIEIIFTAWVILAIRDSSYRPKFTLVLGSVILFLFSILVSTVLSENPFKSFWSNYERMEGYISLLHFGAYFVVLGSTLREQSTWNKLLATSLGASFIMAIYSFFQLTGKIVINQGGVRVDGTFGNATYLGIYMVFHIFFAMLLFMRYRGNWQRILIAIIALMDIVVLYFTATRGAILGFLGGALLTFLFLTLKSERGAAIRKISLGFVIAVVVLVGSFFALSQSKFVNDSPVLSRFTTLSLQEIKGQGRYFVWPMAWKGFLERPIFGWGQESFNFVFNKYYDPRMYNQEPWFDRTHDIVLDWLIAGGLLGLLAYMSLFVAMLYYIRKAKDDFLSKEDKAIVLGLLAAYLFHNIFVFDQIGSYILFFTLLAYVHNHAEPYQHKYWQKIEDKLRSIFDRDNNKAIFESIIVILFVATLYFVNFVPWRQNKNLLFAMSLANSGEYKELSHFQKPLSKYNMGFPEAIEHISQAAISTTQNSSVTPEFRDKLFDHVDKSFQTYLEKTPNDARYRLFYGLFLARFGWYGRAGEEFKKAIEASPQKQNMYFELASVFLLEGKTLEALNAAKTAYELEPSFEEAKIIYGLIALAHGDPNGQKVLLEIDQNKLIFDDRYLSILISLKQFNTILELANARVRLDPQNMQHRITLAAAYLQANMREKAVGVIQEMIVLDPSFKEKGEYFISEIRAGRNP
ncbi:MAG: O-antigen ligase family protein [Patescibacteria group bacterium]